MTLNDQISILKIAIKDQSLHGKVLLGACKRFGFLLAAKELWMMAGRQGVAQTMEELAHRVGRRTIK